MHVSLGKQFHFLKFTLQMCFALVWNEAALYVLKWNDRSLLRFIIGWERQMGSAAWPGRCDGLQSVAAGALAWLDSL